MLPCTSRIRAAKFVPEPPVRVLWRRVDVFALIEYEMHLE